jgi:hypothetical protein
MDAPILPQASNGILSIADLSEEYVDVKIPPYANPNSGDQITVCFKGIDQIFRFSYVYDGVGVRDTGLSVKFQPLNIFSAGKYDVSYEIVGPGGNPSKSNSAQVTIKNPVASMMNPYYQTSFFGTYAEGLLDSWIIALPYTLQNGTAGIVLGDSPRPSTTLEVRHRPTQSQDSSAIGTIQYSGGSWSFVLADDHVDLNQGDELSITLNATSTLSVQVLI